MISAGGNAGSSFSRPPSTGAKPRAGASGGPRFRVSRRHAVAAGRRRHAERADPVAARADPVAALGAPGGPARLAPPPNRRRQRRVRPAPAVEDVAPPHPEAPPRPPAFARGVGGFMAVRGRRPSGSACVDPPSERSSAGTTPPGGGSDPGALGGASRRWLGAAGSTPRPDRACGPSSRPAFSAARRTAPVAPSRRPSVRAGRRSMVARRIAERRSRR